MFLYVIMGWKAKGGHDIIKAMSIETSLSRLDFAVIVAYFAVTLAVGLFMGRFVKSSGDFFSGGKKVPWWMGAISSYMAMISCFVFIAYAQIGYEDGLVGLTVFWSTAFAILAGTFVFARRWQRANLATPIEYLALRFVFSTIRYASTRSVSSLLNSSASRFPLESFLARGSFSPIRSRAVFGVSL